MAQDITEGSKKKGFAARILGEQPTLLQEVYFWLMVLSLLIWPLFFFASLFAFFDTAEKPSTVDGICRIDEICRWGMVLTIWLYPLYLLPLIGLWFRLSRLLRARWLYYFCPLIPVGLFYLFVAID